MQELPIEWNEGNFVLKILTRVRDVVILEKTLVGTNWKGYEVGHVFITKPFKGKGGGNEAFPGEHQFGKKAWSTNTLAKADEIFRRELFISAFKGGDRTAALKAYEGRF